MATGYSVTDALNANSKMITDESAPRARFRTKDISIFKMYRNNLNFYSIEDVEELAGDILMCGLKQNLELTYAPCDAGEYRITAGERRWEALKLLVSKGYREFEIATCKITSPQDADEEQVEIIIANAYRVKTTSDMIEEERRLKASLENIKAAGKTIKGYDLQTGRLRDVIAQILSVSKTKVAQIESINNNLIPEFREELEKERLTFSAAYELSGMPEEEQKEAYDQYTDSGELSYKDIKSMKETPEEEAEEVPEEPKILENAAVSESDTSDSDADQEKESEPEYDADQKADKIPNKCITGWSRYPDHCSCCGYNGAKCCAQCEKGQTHNCNSRCGWVDDPYIPDKGNGKTEEERYAEEQRKIDRETAERLKDQEYEERMQTLPSEAGPKTHRIAVGKTFFEEVYSGKRSFELGKKDKGYRIGDILEYVEGANGRETGRKTLAQITYIIDDAAGIEEEYCVMAISLVNEDKDAGRKEISIPKAPDTVQPPLPAFKNNNEHKAWIEDVEAWGLWYEDTNIEARYYKYDFSDGSRLIAVKYRYTCPPWLKDKADWKDREDGSYTDTHYHMIFSDDYKKDHSFEYLKYYTHTTASINNIIDYIKELQKKEKANE